MHNQRFKQFAMRDRIDACIGHDTDPRRHFFRGADQIARSAAARDELRTAAAMRPRIAVALGCTGAFPVPRAPVQQ